MAEGPDAERAITRLARDGAGIIFTTSFGYMDPTNKVAGNFPDVKFEHATGYKRDHPNVTTYSARFYEGRYVIGQIAARMSKSGVAGYIASFPIPEVVRGINSFLLGAQSINPDFKLKIVWVSTWFDPGKEADAAKVLIGQGADIITQHTDSTAPLQIAAEQGVIGFGQASDMIKFAPDHQLTAIIDDWAPYYVARVKAVLDGTWESTDTWDGMGPGMVAMAPYTNLPDDVVAMAKETEAKITSGEFPSLHRPHPQAGRLDGDRRGRGARRRHPPRHELVREGRRRRASAVGAPPPRTLSPVVRGGERQRAGRRPGPRTPAVSCRRRRSARGVARIADFRASVASRRRSPTVRMLSPSIDESR